MSEHEIGTFVAMRALAEQAKEPVRFHQAQCKLSGMLADFYSPKRLEDPCSPYPRFWRNLFEILTKRRIAAQRMNRRDIEDFAAPLHREFERLLGDISPGARRHMRILCEAVLKACNREINRLHFNQMVKEEKELEKPVAYLPPPAPPPRKKQSEYPKLVYSR